MRRLLTLALAVLLAAWLVRRLLVAAKEPVVTDSPASDSPLTRDQLYSEARRLGVKGRSKMNKQQLQEAVDAARIEGDRPDEDAPEPGAPEPG
jgi:hypothetical protein